MYQTHFRYLTNLSDPIIRFRIPLEIRNATLEYAIKYARTLPEEIIARLICTLEDEETMSRDRLHRLIYCKKLAFAPKGKMW